MKSLQYFLIFTIVAAFLSCDKIDLPIAEPVFVPTDSSFAFPIIDSNKINDSLRMILVEEFTGHKCAGCPTSTKKLLEQQMLNNNNIIVLSLHAGNFAELDPPSYPTDFNTEYGYNLDSIFKLQAYPSAMINRTNDGELFLSHLAWTDPINTSLGQPATIALGLAADLTESNNKLAIRVSAKAIEPIIGNHRLVLVCVEDSVIAPQKDQNSSEPDERVVDYAHRHVLRGKLNGGNTFGEVFSSQIDVDQWAEATVVADLPSNVVNIEKVTIVALIINASTQEIIQSAEAHPHIIP